MTDIRIGHNPQIGIGFFSIVFSIKIETRAVTKDLIHLGWKVYIDGEKYPKKPQDFYGVIAQEEAVRRAWRDYNRFTNTCIDKTGEEL